MAFKNEEKLWPALLAPRTVPCEAAKGPFVGTFDPISSQWIVDQHFAEKTFCASLFASDFLCNRQNLTQTKTFERNSSSLGYNQAGLPAQSWQLLFSSFLARPYPNTPLDAFMKSWIRFRSFALVWLFRLDDYRLLLIEIFKLFWCSACLSLNLFSDRSQTRAQV